VHVQSQDLKSRLVLICDEIGICGLAVYLPMGSEVTIGVLAKGKGLLVMI